MQLTREDIELEIQRLKLEIQENKGNNKYKNENFTKDKKEVILLPVTTRDLNYKNPNLLLLNLTDKSKFDHLDNKIEKERYIYKEELNQSKLIKELSKNKEKKITRQKVSRDIKKLESLGFIVRDEINNNVYKIKYTENKSGVGDYVIIDKRIIKKLINVCNDRAIAVYLYFCYKLRNESQIITRDEICEGVGMSKTKDNRKIISDITELFERYGLVGKEEIYEIRRNKGRTLIRFTLASYEDFRSQIYSKLKIVREIEKDEKIEKAKLKKYREMMIEKDLV